MARRKTVDPWIQVRITRELAKLLMSKGVKGETYDSIIRRLLASDDYQ